MAKKTLKELTPKRNQPIAAKKLRAGGIYAVKYTFTPEQAAKLGTVQEQRGIVMLSEDGKIVRNWNVNEHMDWSVAPIKEELLSQLTYYSSYTIERQFAQTACDFDIYAIRMDKALKDERNHRIELEIIHNSMMNRLPHKIAQWFIDKL